MQAVVRGNRVNERVPCGRVHSRSDGAGEGQPPRTNLQKERAMRDLAADDREYDRMAEQAHAEWLAQSVEDRLARTEAERERLERIVLEQQATVRKLSGTNESLRLRNAEAGKSNARLAKELGAAQREAAGLRKRTLVGRLAAAKKALRKALYGALRGRRDKRGRG